jgi:hypothetical protein
MRTDPKADLVRQVLELDRAGQEEIIEAVLVSLDESDTVDRAWLEDAQRRFTVIRSGEAIDESGVARDLPPVWEDPIVAEVHRIREELLAKFDGDVGAMIEDANRRLLAGEFGDHKVVRLPPRRPPGWRDPDSPDGS